VKPLQGAYRSSPPWWTEADEAERDLLVFELVRHLPAHAARCRACQERRDCPHAQEALEIFLEWQTGRRLLSRATYLRDREEESHD
jgi:hypothetical protein